MNLNLFHRSPIAIHKESIFLLALNAMRFAHHPHARSTSRRRLDGKVNIEVRRYRTNCAHLAAIQFQDIYAELYNTYILAHTHTQTNTLHHMMMMRLRLSCVVRAREW